MIRVFIHNKNVCCQKQLDDYFNNGARNDCTIYRYKRMPIYPTIQLCFRRKFPVKRLRKRRLPKLQQLTLAFYIQVQVLQVPCPSSFNQCDDQFSMLPAQCECPIVPLEPASALEGPYLSSFPFMHLGRFQSVQSVVQADYCTSAILTDAWQYYQELDAFTGLFQHMILLNSFTYWNTVEQEIRAQGFHPKGFTLVEFIKWEMLRHSKGITSYTDAQRHFREYDPEKLKSAFDKPTHIPAPYHESHYYAWLTPAHFRTFFRKLVDDCVNLKIITPRIAIADGLIFRTWAGNFTLDRWMKPTDPGASITVHNKKMLGKCYNAVVFYAWCGTRWLPIDLYVITGSANENSMFQPLVAKFLESSPYDWKVFLYDTGACSAENREFLKNEGIISGITARSNLKKSVVLDLGNRKYCFADDLPEGMSLEQYRRLLNHRSQIEAGFSGFSTYHHMKQMNTMGQDAAEIHVLKYLILQLLHAIAAYKVNRPDLLMMYSAFSDLN